jgi:hypothetical protein
MASSPDIEANGSMAGSKWEHEDEDLKLSIEEKQTKVELITARATERILRAWKWN